MSLDAGGLKRYQESESPGRISDANLFSSPSREKAMSFWTVCRAISNPDFAALLHLNLGQTSFVVDYCGGAYKLQDKQNAYIDPRCGMPRDVG